jgi:AcrR family transcriptional regulator
MTRDSNATRRRILAAAYDRLYREGFARVSVDAIAEAAGVTKKTLYYHFDSKDSLVGAVLEYQHEHALRLVRSWADPEEEDVGAFVTGLFAQLGRWASKPRWLGSGYSRIAMELADMPGHPARVAARRHKQIVEAWLADRLAGMGVEDSTEAAKRTMLLVEGTMTLILIHGDVSYAKSAAEAALLAVGQAAKRSRRR